MSPASPKKLSLTILLVVLALVCVAKATPDTTLLNIGCSDPSYNSGDAYENSVAYVLMALIDVTPSQEGYNYHTVSPYPTAPCFGYANCTQTLANADCANCLVTAEAMISGGCPSKIGAQLGLADCFISYNDYPI